jgi:hypothetical protein
MNQQNVNFLIHRIDLGQFHHQQVCFYGRLDYTLFTSET